MKKSTKYKLSVQIGRCADVRIIFPFAHLFITFFLFHLSPLTFAQDIHFSQFWLTPLVLNPAQAGASGEMRGIVNYKNQWSSVANAYSTINVSWDMKVNKKSDGGFSAVGVNIFHDQAGDAKMQTFQGNLSYAYHRNLNDKSTLGGGFYAGFAQRNINYADLQWMNQYNGKSYDATIASGEPSSETGLNYFDFGAGIHYEYGKGERYLTGNDHLSYNLGLSLSHLTQPKYSFYNTGEKLSLKTVAYGNALIGVGNSSLSLAPGFLFFQQGKTSELLMGTMFRYQIKEQSHFTGFVHGSSFSLGIHYRNKDAFVASLLFEAAKYTFGISYDINISGLKTASDGRGGIEIAFRFLNPNPFTQKSAPKI